MKKRGMSLAELCVGMSLFLLLLMGTLSLMISGMNSYGKTSMDVNLDQPPAQMMRRISETLRPAMDATIDSANNRLYFTLPKLSYSVSSITGEKEYIYPLVADSTNYYYEVKNGKLTEYPSKRVLLWNLILKDPEPKSTQYNKPVAAFQSTTIGAKKCVTLNFITQDQFKGVTRYSRLKTTIVLQNVK